MTRPPGSARLAVALLMMIGYLWGHGRLAEMDDRFFVRSPGGLHALGLYLRGDYPAAGRAYARLVQPGVAPAVARAPQDALVDGLLATALGHARAGRPAESVRTMHRVLWRDDGARGSPASSFAVLTFLGEADGAASTPPSTALRAALHAYLRRLDAAHDGPARAHAGDAVARGDLVPESHVTLSIVQHDAGELVEADASAARALAADPRNPDALLWAAIQAHRRGDVVAEHRLLRTAWDLTPGDPVVGDALGRLFTELGDAPALAALATERGRGRSGGVR